MFVIKRPVEKYQTYWELFVKNVLNFKLCEILKILMKFDFWLFDESYPPEKGEEGGRRGYIQDLSAHAIFN